MNKSTGVAAVFIWIGFVGAISFMEAWLKFRAPGVTLHIGLGIGKLVFAALNKVEWVLLLTVVLSLLPPKGLKSNTKIPLLATISVLLIQTIWLLPALDARAELYINGATVPSSNMHFYYVIAEGIKMISLIILGTSLLSKRQPV